MIPYPGLYNQERMTDDHVVESFVARHDQLDLLLNVLRSAARGGESEHQIVIGQRGMGKSTLLRRIAVGVMRDDELRARFIPLRFREEQYNVITVSAFWRNCCEALAEWCDANGRPALAERIDRSIDRFLAGPAQRDPDEAVTLFLALCRDAGGRPVLLVDNLDLILDALAATEQWGLRRILQMPDGPIVIGAATQFLGQSGDREAPFYEFFHPHLLEPLTEPELMRCMQALADLRREAGAPVRQVLNRQPERLRTLYALTGGNPRVLALIYQIIERSESETVFADLEALLDQVTPFYKARIEDYATPQQRAVIDAIALNWDPMTSRDISTVTGIEVTTISSQLNRLKKDGFIQEVSTSGARSGYQITERFLNIWYLMRHGTRRSKQKLRWLTKFLARLYGPEELRRMADEARDEPSCAWHPHYRAAVIAAYDEVRFMAAEPFSGDDPRAPSGGERTDGGRNRAESEKSASLRMARKADEYYVQGEIAAALGTLDDMIDRFGAATESAVLRQVSWAYVNKGICLIDLGRPEEAVAVCDAVIERFGTGTDAALLRLVARAYVNKGFCLTDLGRPVEAVAVCDAVIDRFGTATDAAVLRQVARAYVNKGACLSTLGLPEEAVAVCDAVIERFGTGTDAALLRLVARANVTKAQCLTTLGQPEEAVAVCDAVIERFNAATDAERLLVVQAHLNKGLCLDELGRSGDAVAAYDAMIDCLSNLQEDRFSGLLQWPHLLKGKILLDHLGDIEAAEASYRAALRIGGNSDSLMDDATWLYLMSARPADAIEMRAGLSGLEPASLSLLDSGIALASDNFGSAVDHLRTALGADAEDAEKIALNNLLRLLRLAETRGYGEKLIDWFEASGNSDRYAPVHAAFVAYVRGERFLLDANPEVRRPAREIYDRLAAPRRASGAGRSVPATPAPRRPRRRRPG